MLEGKALLGCARGYRNFKHNSWPQSELRLQFTAEETSQRGTEQQGGPCISARRPFQLGIFYSTLNEASSPAQGLGYYYNPTHGTIKATSEGGIRRAQRCWNESGEQQSSRTAGGEAARRWASPSAPSGSKTFSSTDLHGTRTPRCASPAPCTHARRIDASHVHLHTQSASTPAYTTRTLTRHSAHRRRTHGGRSPANSGPAEPLSARRSPAGGGTEPPLSPPPLSVRVSPPGTGQRSPPAPRNPDVRGRGCRSGARRGGG